VALDRAKRRMRKGEEQIVTTALTYFARLATAATFADQGSRVREGGGHLPGLGGWMASCSGSKGQACIGNPSTSIPCWRFDSRCSMSAGKRPGRINIACDSDNSMTRVRLANSSVFVNRRPNARSRNRLPYLFRQYQSRHARRQVGPRLNIAGKTDLFPSHAQASRRRKKMKRTQARKQGGIIACFSGILICKVSSRAGDKSVAFHRNSSRLFTKLPLCQIYGHIAPHSLCLLWRCILPQKSKQASFFYVFYHFLM
jgi:hypothetical protein